MQLAVKDQVEAARLVAADELSSYAVHAHSMLGDMAAASRVIGALSNGFRKFSREKAKNILLSWCGPLPCFRCDTLNVTVAQLSFNCFLPLSTDVRVHAPPGLRLQILDRDS